MIDSVHVAARSWVVFCLLAFFPCFGTSSDLGSTVLSYKIIWIIQKKKGKKEQDFGIFERVNESITQWTSVIMASCNRARLLEKASNWISRCAWDSCLKPNDLRIDNPKTLSVMLVTSLDWFSTHLVLCLRLSLVI